MTFRTARGAMHAAVAVAASAVVVFGFDAIEDKSAGLFLAALLFSGSGWMVGSSTAEKRRISSQQEVKSKDPIFLIFVIAFSTSMLLNDMIGDSVPDMDILWLCCLFILAFILGYNSRTMWTWFRSREK